MTVPQIHRRIGPLLIVLAVMLSYVWWWFSNLATPSPWNINSGAASQQPWWHDVTEAWLFIAMLACVPGGIIFTVVGWGDYGDDQLDDDQFGDDEL